MYLKQSTPTVVMLGPFVDNTDGCTAETGLVLNQSSVRLSKDGASFTQKENTSICVHNEHGYYMCDLNSSDTGMLGGLILSVSNESALPVWHEHQVVTANVYDALFSTDKLEVDVGDSAINISTMMTDLDSVLTNSSTAVGEVKDDVDAALANTSTLMVDMDAAESNTSTLMDRVTAARGGYLDNLDVGGDLANTSNQNTFKADVTGLATEAGNVSAVLTTVTVLESNISSVCADTDYLMNASFGVPAQYSLFDQIMNKNSSQTFNQSSDSLEAIRDTQEYGAGGLVCTWTQNTSAGLPMDNCAVWITTDVGGANIVAGYKITDSDGQVTFMLDAGTYYIWRQKGGYDFSNPQAWTVS